MNLYNETGKLKTGELSITRPVSALLIGFKDLAALANERISVYIERAGGNNTHLLTNVPLLDFVLLATYGESAITKASELDLCYAFCELSIDGAIDLGENERLKVSMDNLKSADTYSIEYIEAPVLGETMIGTDRRNLLDGETSKVFGVSEFDLVCFGNSQNISQVTLTYDNGQSVRYTALELRAISQNVDPIAAILARNTISGLSNSLVFPLVGVTSMDIEGEGGVSITLFDRDQA